MPSRGAIDSPPAARSAKFAAGLAWTSEKVPADAPTGAASAAAQSSGIARSRIHGGYSSGAGTQVRLASVRAARVRRTRVESRRPGGDDPPRARGPRRRDGDRGRPGLVPARHRAGRLPRPAADPERGGRARDRPRAPGVPRPALGPRTIDLDLLLYGDQLIVEAGLQVPHPRMHERAFVLEPLAELNPSLVVPGKGPLKSLLAALD